MPNVTMTPEMLASIAGVVLSLLFSYVPGLNTKFAALDSTYKRLIMAGLILVVGIVVVLLSCTGLQAFIVCQKADLTAFVWAVIMTLVANQATYAITPLPAVVKTIIESKVEPVKPV